MTSHKFATALTSGKSFEIYGIEGEYLAIQTGSGLKRCHRSKFQPLDPRIAASTVNGRVDVDLDLIDLNYRPSIPVPSWSPTAVNEPYTDLTKIYIDIETGGLDSSIDRIYMVGLMNEVGVKKIITDPDEKVLLAKTITMLNKKKPNVLIGHNLFQFDLPFIMKRCQLNGVSHPFSYGKHECNVTSASVNGQFIRFRPIYWGNTDILDTYQQIAIWDKAAAKLEQYDLKSSVIALGLREDRRLELDVKQIRQCWESGDFATIQEYLEFDLDDTQALADFLLPVVHAQLNYVPNINLQQLAIASPAKKAQKIHEKLLGTSAVADERVKFRGGTVALLKPGLHCQVAKIDVSSMYPSIMLRYGLCSRKDTENRFLGVLDYMRSERLGLKKLAKAGDKAAGFQEQALKVLINGSYGFFGTGFYSWNDYHAAALITAFGRKILNLMVSVVESNGGSVIEIDSDGIFFSHNDPEVVSTAVADALPDGIEIELEIQNHGFYVPKAKSYVLVSPEGNVTVKGIFRKRNRYPLEKEFPIRFIKLYFTDGKAAAEDYYRAVRSSIIDGSIPVEELTVTHKISKNATTLINLGFGEPGVRVSYWFTKKQTYNKRTGRPNKPTPIQTDRDDYWSEYYVDAIDKIYNLIVSTDNITDDQRIELGIANEPVDPDYGGDENVYEKVVKVVTNEETSLMNLPLFSTMR